MNILQAIIYGTVQGITDFLPVSSTAHLVLIPWLFGWQDPGIVFDVALHLGTAIAVISYFLMDWITLVKSGFTKPKTQEGRLFWLLVLATIPGAIFGTLLDKYAESLRNITLIGIMLIVMGFILFAADKYGKNLVDIKETGIKRSLIIGIAQVFAVIPGISRSGVTMSAGRIMGMNRESIAKFTFLMSCPIILGDALYHAKAIINTQIEAIPFIIAIISSALVGFLSIRFLLVYLKKKGFGLFAIYRLILGTAVILIYFLL